MGFKAVLVQFVVIVFTSLGGATGVAAQSLQLVGLGDSLMAGYQLPAEDALPAQLQRRLVERGFDVSIANAGVSGDTSAGGLARVDWSVPEDTDGVILELGANDALRGIAPEETQKNLENIILRLKERNIPVFLVGMIAPPNMGGDFSKKFNAIYPTLAEKHALPLYPFVLDGVITQRQLLLEDGMHPNRQGLALMADKLLPQVEAFVEDIRRREK